MDGDEYYDCFSVVLEIWTFYILRDICWWMLQYLERIAKAKNA